MSQLTEAFGQQIAYKFIVVSHMEDAVDAGGHQLLLGVAKVTRHIFWDKNDAALAVGDEEEPIQGLRNKTCISEIATETGVHHRLFMFVCWAPLAAWAPEPPSPPAPDYWTRCRSSAPHRLERVELLSLREPNKN